MKVGPIVESKDIKSIKKLLTDNPRDKLLFIMGINSGLRVQDLLALKISDVKGLNVGTRVSIKELKTMKLNVFFINKEIKDALDVYLNSYPHVDNHYLFKSRKGSNYPLTTFAVTKYVKKWCAAINLKGNYGAHSLRKSFCLHQRKDYGVSWEIIAKRLNHSSPSITRRYLGVQDEEVEDILMHDI